MENKLEKIKNEEGIDSISYKTISLVAALGIGLLIASPALMAVLAMWKRNVDFTMTIYVPLIRNVVFPFACSIIALIYLIKIIKLNRVGVSLSDIFKKNPVFVLFLITVLLMIASQFYVEPIYALSGFYVPVIGESFGMELSYIVFILFGATQIKEVIHKHILLRLEIISSIILVLAAFVLWNTQTESDLFSDWTPRFSSIFSNRNYYGYYLSVSVPVSGATFLYEMDKRWKLLAGLSYAANTVALSLCNTLGAWIGAGAAVILIIVAHLIMEKKANIQALALIPVFALCLYVPGHIDGTFESNFSTLGQDVGNILSGDEAAEHAGSGRWRIWKDSLNVIMDHRIFGVGFEGVEFWDIENAPENIRPHNEFMQYALFHGIPMAIMYFLGCLGVFIRALKKRGEMNGATLTALSGAFGYLVGSFFGLTVFSTAYFLFIFLGMGYVNEKDIDIVKKIEENVDNNIS